MDNPFLKLPLRSDLLVGRQEQPRCSLVESITRNLQLIITTYRGECKFDENFGSPIWDDDFRNISSTNSWKDKIAASLEQLLVTKEKRLTNPKVSLNLYQEELSNQMHSSNIMKQKIEVKITGKLEMTSELFEFNTLFYISPLSFD